MRFIIVTASVSVLVANFAFAGEKAIPVSALPAPIQAALAAGYPSASIVEASIEVENGATTYEVSIKLGDRSVDLAYVVDGTQLEEEETVTLTSLPAPVQATIASYDGWSVERIERATAKGATTYEVSMLKGKKRMEVIINRAGVVKSKEQSAHDDR